MDRRNFIKNGFFSLIFPLVACGEKISIKTSNRVSVRDFGAVGDGRNDDTQALKSALQHLKNLNGGTLYIPSGVYSLCEINAFGSFNEFSNIKIIGDGVHTILSLCRGSISFGDFENFTIEKLKFVRNTSYTDNFMEKVQINFSAFSNLTISDVDFDEFGPKSSNKPIPGSTILFLYAGLKTGSVDSVDICRGDSEEFLISNCRFFSGGDRSVNFGIRVYTEFLISEDVNLSDGLIDNCIFDGFNWNAVEILGPNTNNIKVTNCAVLSGGLTGIEIDKGASNCEIDSCEFYNLKGNIDYLDYPNTAISCVVIQGDSPHSRISNLNKISNLKVEINSYDDSYPNNLHGVSLVDATTCIVENVTLSISDNVKNSLLGDSICIYVQGAQFENVIRDTYFEGFKYGIFNKVDRCEEGYFLLVDNVEFPMNVSADEFFYSKEKSCGIKLNN